jgi:hypothetical protein
MYGDACMVSSALRLIGRARCAQGSLFPDLLDRSGAPRFRSTKRPFLRQERPGRGCMAYVATDERAALKRVGKQRRRKGESLALAAI